MKNKIPEPSVLIARGRRAFAADVVGFLKKLLVAGAARQSSLRSTPLSSSSSSTGAARRSTLPFRKRKSEEKKAAGYDKPLSSPAIDPSDASVVAASYVSAAAMDYVERRLKFAANMAIATVEKCGGEVIGRADDVGGARKIVEKELKEAAQRMEDMVQSYAAIVLAVFDEREEAEEGEKGGKEGEEKGEEEGEDGRRDGGDGIIENQVKLEEAKVPLVVEALGLSELRFVKAEVGTEAEAEAGTNKQHSIETKVCRSSTSDGIQQEISRAEEEAVDGSSGITSDGREENMGKDEEQVEMSKKGLATNEETGREGGSIDLEKEEEEEKEERQILDV
ncbi:uncharacterized protein MONOS_13728 [Monocercomonoides exilis]|uniref:uncharacterized protein n=1 Tax=Monocercomonoides exilis TaxID=2049356 RepID=UPI00355A6887|nr:hypothetical protein MONOS_13728 [Monocercomonoides exilis]|eukprot:MONOS_13728.1-p1 / transcript=MONOS_13728.1 / gene=MONOS_13728 / organism=Monocercomonoides_exilis_PA203 / gene_product=unspecified product / transcript_product=unspecified product / location=Mono_scaffold00872:10657-12033(+) / protein_length=336 / sequence_SO=supercontig / SO=protein_coding / is_pseudo=false